MKSSSKLLGLATAIAMGSGFGMGGSLIDERPTRDIVMPRLSNGGYNRYGGDRGRVGAAVARKAKKAKRQNAKRSRK